ncbi:sorting nexin-14-like isoform X2 [Lycorma delicatula]|uniref:sorting nexin-14-like isoform X2 n=1 Tax=Lycorma delicatula TaxID=130591 RepID=UPI003F518DCC
MDSREVNYIISQIWGDKFARFSFSAVSFVTLLFTFLRPASGFMIFVSYISGFIVFNYFMRYQKEMQQWITTMIIGNVGKTTLSDKSENIKTRGLTCSICGEGHCDRDRIIHDTKPWDGLLIPEQVDSAIEELLNKILDEFITSWYKDVSTNSDFQNEIKRCVRYTASVILARGLQVDIGKLVTEKLIPAAVRHVESQVRVAQGFHFNPHPTVYSRECELNYLRALTSKLLPIILQHPHLHCKNYSVLVREIIAGWLLLPFSDALSDPAVLNSLLVILLGRQPLTQYPIDPELKKVEFLANFVQLKEKKDNTSALHPDMCSILKEQSLLYSFMQFLKNQGAVNILQFCLDVEEFNRRMLIPELTTEELDRLYKDAWDLFSVYFSQNSPDAIPFPAEYITNMRKVLSKDVTKLRTSPPLFQAYEFAYNMLDSTYCPQFHNSDDFYMWLCGPRVTSNTNKSGSSAPINHSTARKRSISKLRLVGRNQDGSSTVSRIGSRLNKIKGALKSQPVMEGQAYNIDASLELETDSEFAEALHLCETERDLSAWRVSIPSVTSRFDQTTGKVSPVYLINVQRIDVTEGDSSQWTVERRLVDFYTLEAKLAEFHGEFTDAQLPPRRLLGTPPPGSRSESTHIYEEYLQKLLAKPSLRGSDLLFSFLSFPGEFVAEASALGRLIRRSVPLPLSLRKERGQNLDPFITMFFTSTESRSKNSKIEWKDMSEELSPRKQRNITNSIFGDNLGLSEEILRLKQPPVIGSSLPLKTPSQCLVFFVVKAFSLPRHVLRLVVALQSFCGNLVDSLLHLYINYKLNTLLVPPRLAHLINLLQHTIFESRNPINRSQVSVTAECLINEAGWLTKHIYLALYTALQNPLQNKQLFYALFDTCIVELFPELRNDDSDKMKQIFAEEDEYLEIETDNDEVIEA